MELYLPSTVIMPGNDVIAVFHKTFFLGKV